MYLIHINVFKNNQEMKKGLVRGYSDSPPPLPASVT